MRRSARVALVGLLALGAVAASEPEPPGDGPAGAEAAGGPFEASERVLEELRQERLRLDLRERDLAAREAALVEAEAEARRLLAEVEAIQAAVEKKIAEFEEPGGAGIDRLAKVYASMAASRAAPLLEALEPALSTQILTRMKHKQSAKVLALMSSDAALRVSRRAARSLEIDTGTPAGSPEGAP